MDKRHVGANVYIDYDGSVLVLTVEYGKDVADTIYLDSGMLAAMVQYNLDVAAEIRATQAANNEPGRVK